MKKLLALFVAVLMVFTVVADIEEKKLEKLVLKLIDDVFPQGN